MRAVPLGNIIPDWNDLVYRGRWKDALADCTRPTTSPSSPDASAPRPARRPACWASTNPPVTIEEIEKKIIEHAFAEGWMVPEPPANADRQEGGGDRVRPRRAGRGAATEPRRPLGDGVRAGADRPAGCCATAFPDFKMEKWVIDRRLDLMEEEGITFRNGAFVGKDITREGTGRLRRGGAVPGGHQAPRPARPRPRSGRHPPRHGLPALAEPKVAGEKHLPGYAVTETAEGKHVIVIGGGDTGSDCIGTSQPAGREVGDQLRAAAHAPGRAAREPALALLADAAAHQHLARGRLRTLLAAS